MVRACAMRWGVRGRCARGWVRWASRRVASRVRVVRVDGWMDGWMDDDDARLGLVPVRARWTRSSPGARIWRGVWCAVCGVDDDGGCVMRRGVRGARARAVVSVAWRCRWVTFVIADDEMWMFGLGSRDARRATDDSY